MATKRRFQWTVVLAGVFMAAVMFHGSTAAAGLSEIGGMMGVGKPNVESMLMDNLGVRTDSADAEGLLSPGRTVSGEVADPTKLTNKGLDGVNMGDKMQLSNVDGKTLAVKHLLSGRSMSLDMDTVFGAASKLFMK